MGAIAACLTSIGLGVEVYKLEEVSHHFCLGKVRLLARQTVTLVWVLNLYYLIIVHQLPPTSKRQHVVVVVQHVILQTFLDHLLLHHSNNCLVLQLLFDDTLPSDAGSVNSQARNKTLAAKEEIAVSIDDILP